MNIMIFQRLKKTILRLYFVLLILMVALAPFSGIARAQVPQTSCYEIWDTLITVSNSTGLTRDLRIGQGLYATNNLDDCDSPAPPLPPGNAFEALITNGSTDYFVDYRPANLPGTLTWLVRFQDGPNGDPITFSWDPGTLPGAGSWFLRDNITHGYLVNVDMRTYSSLELITYPDLQSMEVVYTTTRCTVTARANGNWNEPGTWNTNCSGIPSPLNDVLIPDGMAVNFNNGATTVESLTIGDGVRLSFSTTNPLLVSDNAFVRGGTLDLGTDGNLTVNGALTNLGVMQQTKEVNVMAGNAPEATVSFMNIGGYGGLTLTSNTTSLGSTTVRIVGGQLCDTDNTSVWRCFTLTPEFGVSDAEIDFYYAANELNTSVCESMAAWRSTGGRNWISAGTVGTHSCDEEPYSVAYSSVIVENAGSYFALRSTAGPTAITLRTFNANVDRGYLPILLIVGIVGLASLSWIATWWAYKRGERSL